MAMPDRPIVMGVIGTDPHAVGYRVLQRVLTDAGFKVVGLGTMVPPDEFIRAAIETNACAILITSLSGFGEFYAQDFRKKCEEAGLKDIRLYMGGHIVMGERNWNEVEAKFTAFGFDRVALPHTLPQEVIKMLEEDLGSND